MGRIDMKPPWLSVIVPSHNRERWLAAALQSLVEQEDPGIEVIVIDASATDACLQIVSKFADKLDIRAQHRPDLVSRPEKANFGVEQARSNRICILDDDDLWLPNKCATLREWLAIQPDGVMHLHPCHIIDISGRRLGLWRCPLPNGQSAVPSGLFFERLLIQNFIPSPAPTLRRDAYRRVGGLDNQLWYTADWDLYFKLASVGNVYYHSSPLACYRVHQNTLTGKGNRNLEDFRRQYELVVDRHFEKLTATQRDKILRIARASIDVNTALAAASGGDFAQIFKALAAILSLGPHGLRRYLFCSRILERALPRLRALLSGRL
jgi:glycosyltransferase involved in cell wall biosynthesis